MRIHVIGIGGTGMGNLAVLLARLGHDVRGSDSGIYPPMSEILEDAGIPVDEGWDPSHLRPWPDLVVVGNVCRPDHPEARAAIEAGLPTASMPATLRGLVLGDRRSLVVTGTHGKTTTTSMLVHVLEAAGLDPGYLVGGRIAGRDGGAAPGSGPWFAVEGDEYDSAFFEKHAKFLSYVPEAAILTSVEHDHVDIYPTPASYESAFRRLVTGLGPAGVLVACADDERVTGIARLSPARTVPYGTGPGASFAVVDHEDSSDGARFGILADGDGTGEWHVPLRGLHNALDAAAVAALCVEHVGLDPALVRDAMAGFPGVDRRQETRARVAGIEVLDDFGHHPTAVALTIGGLRGSGGRVVAVLRPASATACRNLHQDGWVEALARADAVVVAPVARPDIPDGERLDTAAIARDLEARGIPARSPEALADVPAAVTSLARAGDTVVFFSNSDTGAVLDATVESLARAHGS